MVTQSSILAWRIPRTEEPGGLESMGSQGVRHCWGTNTFTFFILNYSIYIRYNFICIYILKYIYIRFWTVVLKKALESPLDSKEIKPVNPKGNQPWIFIGRTDAEAEAPVLWPPDAKSWLIGKDPEAGKDWRQEEKGTTENEMVGWHHRLNGQEFEQTPGDSEGQGSLVCCSSPSHKNLDMT